MNRITNVLIAILLISLTTSCQAKSSSLQSSAAASPSPSGGLKQEAVSPSPAAAAPSPAAEASASPSEASAQSVRNTAASPAVTLLPVQAEVGQQPPVYPNIPVKHVVIVVEENHSYAQIVENGKAPYLQSLIKHGALFTNAYAITHPSQPNYFALFSGSTQNIKDDSCKGPYSEDNLATELAKAKLSFAGYSEQLPAAGFTGCYSKSYARKHNPWAQFTNVPKEQNLPLQSFPKDYSKLPTVSFVIPALENDMHDGTIEEADNWLKDQLADYAEWANSHQSLLIVTWDEDDNSPKNHIPVLFYGPMIKPGKYDDEINHYHVLRTIEDLYKLGRLGETKKVDGISAIWK